jgi:HK97 family phage portal protein
MLTPEQAEHIRKRFEAMHADRGTAVLSQGLSYSQVQINPDDSQFIELQRFVVEQVCRFMGVPPSMVYAAIGGSSITYANVSQADTQYLKHSLQLLMRDIECAWSDLIVRPQYVKFNPSTLLRMDDISRHDLHAKRLEAKTTTVNAVRALEDEDPFADPAFDEPGIPAGPTMSADEDLPEEGA